VKAVLLTRTDAIENHPLEVREIETPSPGPGQVLLRVTACGVCRSNLHMIEGEWLRSGLPAKLPIIPGHEIVGRIAAVGEGVTSFSVSDRAGIQPLWSTCGACEFCMSGREQICPTKEITGETVDGGFAEYVLGMAAHTYPLPEALSDAEAAPLFCPGITAYGAISKLRMGPGQELALFGMGGVGHIVLQIAKLYGMDVTVISRGANHLELARELGATRTIDASTLDAVEELKRSGGADAAIVFAPSSAVVRQAVKGIKPGGTVVLGAAAEVGPFPFPEEKTLIGTLLGRRQQMLEVLDLAAAGKITATCEVFPLDRAEEALTRLKRGEFAARAVLVP
jgi:alcohol dehydrogenase, propanol-preferring